MALLPLLALVVLHLNGQPRGPEWWCLAAAFGVSWLADWAAHWLPPLSISLVYPVLQTALVCAVFLVRRHAMYYTLALVGVGVSAALLPVAGDVFLRLFAWVSIAFIVWPLPLGRVRQALILYFFVGLAAWMAYRMAPGWPTWLVYQSVRAVALGMMAWAAVRPRPALSLA